MSLHWLMTYALPFVGYNLNGYALYLVAIPIFYGVFSSVFHRVPFMRDTIIVIGSLDLLGAMFSVFFAWYGQDTMATPFVLSFFYGSLGLAFHLEPLTIVFALLVTTLWIPTTIYAIGYMRAHHERHQTLFYIFLHGAIAATLGVALSANLLTFFFFYEMLTLSTIPLILHARTPDAVRNTQVYMGILIGTSTALLLPCLIYIFVQTGTLDFVRGGIIGQTVSPVTATILFSVLILSIAKLGMMPFHRWLPAAMVAPTPVSALLHAVAVVKSGAFGAIKIVLYIFGLDTLKALVQGDFIMYLASFTVIAAGFIAMGQDNLKKRLAYSTIANLSYIVLVLTLFSGVAVLAAILHLVAHAISKITLFFAAGAILVTSHRSDISSMAGLGKAMPLTFFAFAVGAFSLMGLPLFAGFISKYYIFKALLLDGHAYVPIAVFVLSPILSALYYLPVVYRGYFMESKHPITHGDAPPLVLYPMLFVALLTVLFFFIHGWIFTLVAPIVL